MQFVLLLVFHLLLLGVCVLCSNKFDNSLEEKNHSNSLFYIYEWPDEVQSSWPLSTASLAHHKKNKPLPHFKHTYCENFGNGPLLDAEQGLYGTWMFQLYSIVMSKLRVHPRRTYNRDKASIFIIPYDLGADNRWIKENGMHITSEIGCRLAPKIKPLLEQELQQLQHERPDIYSIMSTTNESNTLHKSSFILNENNNKSMYLYGHDHVLLHSYFDFLYDDCCTILQLCVNCTVFAIDSIDVKENYFNKMFVERTSWGKEQSNHFRWQGMPYPSAIHWTPATTDIPWLPSPTISSIRERRPYRVVFWGSKITQNNLSTKVRTRLIDHCLARPEICWYLQPLGRLNNPCHTHKQHDCVAAEMALSPTLEGATVNKSHLHIPPPTKTGISLYRESIFCLQPPGDMEIRNGIFDSLLAGCIPVLFLEHILHKVYPLYLSRDEEESITAYIPALLLRNDPIHGDNMVDILAKISDEEILRKQQAIAKIVPRLHYAIPPSEHYQAYSGYCGGPPNTTIQTMLKKAYQEADNDESYPVGQTKAAKDRIINYQSRYTWKPPFEDAVDHMLNQIEKKVNRYKKDCFCFNYVC